MSAMSSCDFFAELVDLPRLSQVVKEGFLVWVALELLNQPFDFVFAICVLLLDYGNGYAKDSVVHGVVPSSPGTL